MYACPSCKRLLEQLQCAPCNLRFASHADTPSFFTPDPLGQRYREIAAVYDGLYRADDNVWQVVGRTAEFTNYITALVAAYSPKRYLDVCCGQGFLLASVSADEKFGMDISRTGLQSASTRSAAHLCQGFAEQLPYPDNYFDVITNIGGTEHFIDDIAATREAHRVLRPGGRYLVLLLTDYMLGERVRIKVGEFVCPRFRPLSLARWAWTKLTAKGGRGSASAEAVPLQPVQNRYSPRSAAALFSRAGFQIDRVITKRLVPDAPLDGHYIRLYVLAKA